MKRKIIIPKTATQHIKEELKKNPEFRKAYDREKLILKKLPPRNYSSPAL